MRSIRKASSALPLLALIAGCAVDAPIAPAAIPVGALSPAVGGCTLALTSGILPPINADNTSVFELTRTIPVKIRAVDCVTGQSLNNLAPMLSLVAVGSSSDTDVNEVESSSAADDGVMMRNAGDGQYIFNLSTKRSQFNAGQDLTPGRYRLTISGDVEPVVVEFVLRR